MQKENIKKLSLEPYKGTRDFYPEDMFLQKYIFSVMRRVVESYGYQEYDASILEETDLYRAKSGEEIINEQTYSFIDRGGRDVTIRPEMTPTAARMVAQKRKELAFPLRWYSIPNLLRYERPQRGRLREHWQLNVDIFGVEGIGAEKEMIMMSTNIMKAFGAKDENFSIKINSRALMNYFYKYLELDEKQSYAASKLIDRKKKMEEKEFNAQAKEILKDEGKVKILINFLNVKDIGKAEEILEKGKKGEMGERGIDELEKLIDDLKKSGIKNIIFDPTLMRGFDYYTGIVFEVFDNNPENNRALFGGGRYDDLVGIFNVEKVPAAGFGMGDVTIRDFLETYKLTPPYRPLADLYICRFSFEYGAFADELAGNLRCEGVNAAVDLTDRKIGAQIKTADRQKIPFALCIGEDEVKSGKFKLKNMRNGEEKVVDREGIIEEINRNL